ncbi:MAG: ABC transporter permease [Deinococcaceae bacterium]
MTKRHLIFQNALVFAMGVLVFYLFLFPYTLTQSIKTARDYPAGTWILRPQPGPTSEATTSDDSLAQLKQWQKDGRLAFHTSPLYSANGQPKIRFSKSLIDLGIVTVSQGAFDAQSILVQDGHPFGVGTKIVDQQKSDVISGKLKLTWMVDQLDTSVLFVPESDLSLLDGGDFPVFYFKGSATETEQVHAALQNHFGLRFEAKEVWQHYQEIGSAMLLAQTRLQKDLATVLLIATLLKIYSDTLKGWHQRRERLRIERTLGRPLSYFYMQWYVACISQWFPGFALAAATALIYGWVRSDPSFLPQWAALFCAIALPTLGTMYTLIHRSTQVALAKTSDVSAKSSRDHVVLIASSVLLGFAIPYFFSGALKLFVESKQAMDTLGIDRTIVFAPQMSKKMVDLCENQNGSCVSFGYSGIHLWNTRFDMTEHSEMSNSATFDFSKAQNLGVTLTEGKWPSQGKKELLVNQKYLADILKKYPDFGVGKTLDLGFKVVGIVDTHHSGAYDLDEGLKFLDAALFIPSNPRWNDTFFAAPLGKSGAIFQFKDGESKEALSKIYARFGNVRVLSVSDYAQKLYQSIEQSLIILSVLLAATSLAVFLTFANDIHLLLMVRSLEISIRRMLGMSSRALSGTLFLETAFVILFSIVPAIALGAFLRYRQLGHMDVTYFTYAFVLSAASIVLIVTLLYRSIRLSVEKNSPNLLRGESC